MPTPGGSPIILSPQSSAFDEISRTLLQTLVMREQMKVQRERLKLAEREDARAQAVADRTAAQQDAADRAAADILLSSLGFSGGMPQGVDPVAMLQGGSSAFAPQPAQPPAGLSPASPFNLSRPVPQPLAPGPSGAVAPPFGPQTPSSPALAQQLMENPVIAGAVRDLGDARVPPATVNQRVVLAAAEAQKTRDINRIVRSIPKLTKDQRTQLQSVLEARDRMTAEAFNDAVSLILPVPEHIRLNMEFVAQQIETMKRSGQAAADTRIADIAATTEAKRLGVFPTTFPEYVPGAANMFLRLREIAAQKTPKATDVTALIVNYVRNRANDVKASMMMGPDGRPIFQPRVSVAEATREITNLTIALGIVEEGSPLHQRITSPAFQRMLEAQAPPPGGPSMSQIEQAAISGAIRYLQQNPGVSDRVFRTEIMNQLRQGGVVPADSISPLTDRIVAAARAALQQQGR